MKKLLISLLGIFLLLTIIPSQNADAAKVNGFNFKAGDIIVTSNTVSSQFVGHAGIVDGSGEYIIHITPKNNKTKKTTRISIKEWLNQNKNTKVVRYKDATKAKKAGAYAYNNYFKGRFKNVTYGFKNHTNSKDTKELYCSELVWQSYYWGASVHYKVMINPGGRYSKPYAATPGFVKPYAFTNTVNQKSANGSKFSTVKTFGKW